jgi:hypothetical protein
LLNGRDIRRPPNEPNLEVRRRVIDAIAERRRISRDEAWSKFKTCAEAREARKAGSPLDCDTI